MGRPSAADVLAAVARGEVDGQASAWWLRSTGGRVTAVVRRLQADGLVVDVVPPPAGRVVAELTDAGRAAVPGIEHIRRLASAATSAADHPTRDGKEAR